MKGSVKLFIASMIVFACALGFFAGALCFNHKAPCEKSMMMPPPPPGGPGMGHENGFRGPRAPKASPEYLDSLLQVTPEQKALLAQQKASMDSTSKAIGKQRRDAEKMLREALDSNNDEQINAAKAAISAAQSAMLDHRVNNHKQLVSILSAEQMEKFRAFHKENMKKGAFGHHKGPHGPKGPKPGQVPPPPQN